MFVPLFRVPASGRSVTVPSRNVTNISGLDPTIENSSKSKKNK